MRASTLRALVVGAVTWDHDLDRPAAPPVPGGVATFAGCAFARLGLRTRVVTRIAPAAAAALAPLRAAGVEVLALPSARTTTYANRYRSGQPDRHELRDRSDPVRVGDVPPAWLEETDVVQAGPLHPYDVEPAALAGARGLVGVDLQGLGRDASLGHEALAALVRGWCGVAAVVQASAADAPTLFDASSPRAVRSAYGIEELLITRGARGVTVAAHTGVVDVPAEAVAGGDPRGAGDVFLAAYLAARALAMAPTEAAAAAARVAGRSIAAGTVPRGALG